LPDTQESSRGTCRPTLTPPDSTQILARRHAPHTPSAVTGPCFSTLQAFQEAQRQNFYRLLSAALLVATTVPLSAQQVPWSPLKRGSDNIEVLGHLPLGARLSVADMDMEQEMDRPYVYVSRMVYGFDGPKGTDIISIADPENPVLLYEWRIEDQDLHQRTGGMDVKHFKWNDRYYLVQSLQFGQGGRIPTSGP